MKKSVGVRWGSLKVGILLSLAIAALFWASFTGGGTSIFEPKKEFVCYFTNVNGLVSGAPVWMSGVEIGNVKSVSFVNISLDKQVKLVCRAKESVWNMITDSARVSLGTIGFLGDKYVEIIPSTSGQPIAEGTVIPTEQIPDASALFSSGKDAFENVGDIVSNLDTTLVRLNRGEGTLGMIATDKQLYTNLTRLLSNLTQLTSDLQKNQERLISSIERTSRTIDELGAQVTENRGTLGRIVNDPALYDNLAASTAKLDTIMSAIQNAEGSLGLLVNDTALYTEVVNLLARSNNLMSDLEQNWRHYLKFSVF
jgi:phospholipid/cholesterol/gamma-HCH transport system substrate-binding protein